MAYVSKIEQLFDANGAFSTFIKQPGTEEKDLNLFPWHLDAFAS
jgi:hypothetical protein